MARILVVEHDAETRSSLDAELRAAGHAVRLAATGTEALRLVRDRCPDIVLLDSSVPDLDALDVARLLRVHDNTASLRVIVIAKNQVAAERIRGLENGVDDCLVTPFTMRELILRIRALHDAHRRHGEGPISIGDLRIDRDAGTAFVREEEIVLTALELKLLVTLCDRRDRVQTRDVLLADVWDTEASIDTRTVDTHITRLRDKLGAMRDCVATVRGIGYKFVSPKDSA